MANVRLVPLLVSIEIDLDGMQAEYGEPFDSNKAHDYLQHDIRESVEGFPYAHAIKRLEIQ